MVTIYMCGIVECCLWSFCKWKTPWNYFSICEGISSWFQGSISSRYDQSCCKRYKTPFLPSLLSGFGVKDFSRNCAKDTGYNYEEGNYSHWHSPVFAGMKDATPNNTPEIKKKKLMGSFLPNLEEKKWQWLWKDKQNLRNDKEINTCHSKKDSEFIYSKWLTD